MDSSREAFLSELKIIVDEFFVECGYPTDLVDHTNKMIRHSMPDHIEASIPLLFPEFCKFLNPTISADEKQQILLLGWIYQLLSSHYVFLDDYLDDSKLRWGKISWPELHNQSKLIIIPDLLIIRSLIFYVLKKKFSHLPSIYLQVLHLFLDCDSLMSKGLRLEEHQLIRNLRDGKVSLESYNMDTYKLIFGLQFSTMFLYLPLALSLTISGYPIDEYRELYRKLEKVCTSFGVLLKACDDYYEIFPSTKIDTDGSDTDIRKGQFTWLFLMAKESCKSEDRIKYLLENYGHDNNVSVANFMDLLDKIGIHDLFTSFRKYTYENTIEEIKSSFGDHLKIQEMLGWFFNRCMKHYDA